MALYIGIDGGASSTRGVLIDESGNTLNKFVLNQGSNLKVYEDLAPKRIIELINKLCNDINLSTDDISAFGLGLAAVSCDKGRELLFKELDRINISDKTILINDAEAAYRVSCQENVGVLVTVGTGVICIGRSSNGNFFRTAGKGHDAEDIGSGYWIGKEAFLKLALNEALIEHDPNLLEIRDIIFTKYKKDNFNDVLEYISEHDDTLSLKASIAKDIISISNTNKIALKIIQEATFNVADYIINLVQMLDYKDSDNLVLFGNGSVINSPIYRSSLNDALSFHYPEINWIFSKISASYGSAMIAAFSKDKISINVKDILKGAYLASS